MMMKRKSTITAPAVTRICTAARKKALSMTNSPAMKTMVKVKQSALATGLRLKHDRQREDDHARGEEPEKEQSCGSNGAGRFESVQ